MFSIDDSVSKFIMNPDTFHLKEEGGIIKAVSGRSQTDEKVHEKALKALSLLVPQTQSRKMGSAVDLATQCTQAEDIYHINKWALDSKGEENKAEAASRIKEAYLSNSDILDLTGLGLR